MFLVSVVFKKMCTLRFASFVKILCALSGKSPLRGKKSAKIRVIRFIHVAINPTRGVAEQLFSRCSSSDKLLWRLKEANWRSRQANWRLKEATWRLKEAN